MTPSASQWIYIQNCVSEVPPGGSGNKVHLNPWTLKKKKINRATLSQSITSITHNPLCWFCLPLFNKLASQLWWVLPFSSLVLAATINNHQLHKAERSASVLALPARLWCGWRLQRGIAARVVRLVLPMSAAAAAAQGWRVTYGARRISCAGWQPGGGGGALGAGSGGGEARAGALALAEVPLAFANQRLLVALHPLQLLLRRHSTSGMGALELRGLCGWWQTLQGTLRSLLRWKKVEWRCTRGDRWNKEGLAVSEGMDGASWEDAEGHRGRFRTAEGNTIRMFCKSSGVTHWAHLRCEAPGSSSEGDVGSDGAGLVQSGWGVCWWQ